MELTEHRCKRCGGELRSIGNGRWSCPYCACTYDEETAVKNTRSLHEEFDEVKREIVCNLRRNLYDAVNDEYVSSTKVKECCVELKKNIPDDFAACFYEVAVGNNVKQLTKYIRKINVEKNYDEIDSVVRFLIKSLQTEYLLELNNLVERAYKMRDLSLFEKYSTEISKEAEKVENGVYETKMPREVFVAYSSKDMDKVSELVEVLEEQGLKCFVAARNLRHGKGSVENYERLLCEAMDHCKSFVFVSSVNSRNFSCDALTKELPYIQERDIENAPAEYKNNYSSMPHKYKKPRVEYRIEESRGFNAADSISNEFFDGYERVYSPEAVAERVALQLVSAAEKKAEKKQALAPAPAPVAVQSAPAEVVGQRIEPILKRAAIFIDDGEWDDAEAYCEKALDIDPECTQAYIYKLMIDLRVKKQDELVNCKEPFENNGNFKKAVRFGDAETVDALNGYVEAIKESNETERKNKIYNLACSLMREGNIDAYNIATLKFGEIPTWRDSKEQIEKCHKAIKQIKEKAEAERKDDIYSAAFRLMTLETIEGYVEAIDKFGEIPNWRDSKQQIEKCREAINKLAVKAEEDRKNRIYNHACALMVNEDSQSLKIAIVKFKQIPGWRDADEKILECDKRLEEIKKQIEIAMLAAEKRRRKAIKISAICLGIIALVIVIAIVLNTVIIPAIEENQSYNNAISLMDDGKYEEAIEAFEALDGYKDSQSKIENCKTLLKDQLYETAVKYMDEGKYDEAKQIFETLDGYKSSATHILNCVSAVNQKIYDNAVILMKNGMYEEAIREFRSLGKYKDNVEKIEECNTALKDIDYNVAVALMTEGKYAEAIIAFEALGGHKDSATKIEECKTALKDIDYDSAVALMTEGKYAEAIVAFEVLGDHKDSSNLLEKCNHYAKYRFSVSGEGYSISGFDGNDTDLEIPNKYNGKLVVSIDRDAFNDCSNLTSITIPDSVTSIGVDAFYNCSGLTSISVDEKNAYYKSTDGDLYSKDGKTLIQYAIGKTETSFVIPNGVTSIGVDAFRGCNNLTSITIPDSVTSIGVSAFKECSSLASITLPFVGTLKDGTGKTYFGAIFGASAYKYNGGSIPQTLKKVIITGGEIIDSYAFYGCTNLVTVSIPKSITRLNYHIFDRCDNMESVIFIGSEDEWQSVSKYNEWNYCRNSSGYNGRYLPLIFAPECDGVNHYIEINAAVDPTCTETGLTEGSHCYICETVIVAQETVDALGHDEIQHEAKEPTCAEVGWAAYVTCSRCDYTTYSETPARHDIIYHEAKVPTCTEIGWDAYVTCSRCDYSTYSEKPIYSDNHDYNFENKCTRCGNLYEDIGVVFALSNGEYIVADYTGDATSVIIPSKYKGIPVTSIGDYAFWLCSSLTSVTIPDSVTSIGYYVFYGCSSLTTVNYTGSEEQWAEVSIGSRNSPLKNATIVYNYVPEGE